MHPVFHCAELGRLMRRDDEPEIEEDGGDCQGGEAVQSADVKRFEQWLRPREDFDRTLGRSVFGKLAEQRKRDDVARNHEEEVYATPPVP